MFQGKQRSKAFLQLLVRKYINRYTAMIPVRYFFDEHWTISHLLAYCFSLTKMMRNTQSQNVKKKTLY